jgi:protein disulfide-isomerase-like protein
MKFKLNKSIAQLKNFFKPSKMPKLLLIVAILLIVYFIYVNYLKEGFEVESEDLDEQVKEGKKVVLFYADWCGHCKKLKPVWEKAAEKVNKEEKRMIMVNCGDDKKGDSDIMSKYNIKGYPTIMIFEDGEHKEYNGERTLDDLLALF